MSCLAMIHRTRVIHRVRTLRTFSTSQSWSQAATNETTNVRQFRKNHFCRMLVLIHNGKAWLLCKDPKRIPEYPYQKSDQSWFLIGWLPVSIQHAICRYMGTRALQLNTGEAYFPDQFLLGAKSACRPVLQLLSKYLSDRTQETREELEPMLGEGLLQHYTKAAEAAFGQGTSVSISLPQIYDVNYTDVWMTLGNPAAFVGNHPKYYDIEWMTLRLGLKRNVVEQDDAPFAEHRQQVSVSLLEGLQIMVDVDIDADVVYKVTRGDDVLLYDEGRRTVVFKFSTPYFHPAHKIVSGRDPDTGDPINRWSWQIIDIDQLVEKSAFDASEE